MSIQSLIKEEDKLLKKNREIIKVLASLKTQIENLDLSEIWKESESGVCPLLEIAGFAEIGPMNSKEIDEEIYKL